MSLRLTVLASLGACGLLLPESRHSDVVVYGGTAGGLMAAVAAAQEGSSVILLEPRNHVGGMVSGGLGRTDMDGQQHLIGGLARRFFVEVGQHYSQQMGGFFEPKVAEGILRDFLVKAGVIVLYGQPLLRVSKQDNRIAALETRNGMVYSATVFVDATYEGDLLKAAGVSYAIGREGRSKWGESFAGRQELVPGNHQLRVPTLPYDDEGRLFPTWRRRRTWLPWAKAMAK